LSEFQKDILYFISAYLQITVWFFVFYFLGAFDTVYAPFFAMIVLLSHHIDVFVFNGIKSMIKKYRS